ncbi:hypothetical protein BST81_01820 [Leptolyngbya sp. 'hensonii']|nr:hypothetical protein BST81_01820 [Leptolyngbya sp. 'hensonii']
MQAHSGFSVLIGLLTAWGCAGTALASDLTSSPFQMVQVSEPFQQGKASQLLEQGIQMVNAGNIQPGIQLEQQALVIFQQTDNERGEAQTLIALAEAYLKLKDDATAAKYAQRAFKRAQRIGDSQLQTAATALLSKAQGHPAARGAASENIIPADPASQQAQVIQLLLQAGQEANSGEAAKGIQTLEQALPLVRELKNPQLEWIVLFGLGAAYNTAGNYAKGIQYSEQSLSILRELQNQEYEGMVLASLANTYATLGDYDRAIYLYNQVLTQMKQRQDYQGKMFAGAALFGLGSAYKTRKEYAVAIQFYQQSLVIARELKGRQAEAPSLPGSNSPLTGFNEGIPLATLGDTYREMGDYAKAIQFNQEALTATRQLNNRLIESALLLNSSSTYGEMGNYPAAIQSVQQSLTIARELKNQRLEGLALGNLGDILLRMGKLAAAEEPLVTAIEILETQRQGLQDLQQVSLADTYNQAEPYSLLQRVLLGQKKVEAALEVAERARARAFATLVAKRGLGAEAMTLSPIKIAAIQQVAREQNATLVEYANIQDKQLVIWVVSPQGRVSARQVDLKELQQEKQTLTTLVASTRCLGLLVCEQAIASRGGFVFNVTQGDRQFGAPPDLTVKNQYLRRLHRLLIEPIGDLLPKDPKDHVIFVPHRELFLIPFAALQNGQGKYLIEQHTISIAPSIQVLQLTHQQRQRMTRSATLPSGNAVLVVGNPTMPIVQFKVDEPPKQLAALPGAEQEAIAIAKLLDTSALIGPQATKAAVRQRMPQARIIHLATHGLLDDFGGLGIPGAIALAPDTNVLNEGLLTASELLEMNLQAELVVLSACDTGQGKITGDGVIGLSRALITAGVPTVIVSLWKVPDAPTAELMTQFYRNLNQGQDKATALRQAMLATKQNHPNPTIWAAFMAIGEAE